MSHGNGTIQPILDILPHNLNGLTILDIGCGFGEVMLRIKAYSGCDWVHYKGQPKKVTGIDINPLALKFSMNHNIYDEVIKFDAEKRDITELGLFNIIICTEFMEHTNLGIDFLNKLKVMGDLVIVTMPYGLTDSGSKLIGFIHKQGLTPKIFREAGYKVSVYDMVKLNKYIRMIMIIGKLFKRKNIREGYGILAVYDRRFNYIKPNMKISSWIKYYIGKIFINRNDIKEILGS